MDTPIVVTAGYEPSIRFWMAHRGEVFKLLPHSDSHVNCLEIAPNYVTLAVGGSRLVRLYDIHTAGPIDHQPLVTYDGHSSNVTSVGFESQGRWFFTSSEDGFVKVWDFRANGLQIGFDNHSKAVHSTVLLSSQTELVFGDQAGRLQIWDLRANKICKTASPEKGVAFKTVAASPEGRTIAAANHNGTVFLWRNSKGEFEKMERNYKPHNGDYVLKARFSPNSRYLSFTSSDGTCSVWLHQSEALVMEKVLQGHKAWVWDCVFSTDSAYIITGSSDGTTKLWDVESGKRIMDYTGSERAVTSLALLDAESISDKGSLETDSTYEQKGKILAD